MSGGTTSVSSLTNIPEILPDAASLNGSILRVRIPRNEGSPELACLHWSPCYATLLCATTSDVMERILGTVSDTSREYLKIVHSNLGHISYAADFLKSGHLDKKKHPSSKLRVSWGDGPEPQSGDLTFRPPVRRSYAAKQGDLGLRSISSQRA